MMFGTKLPPLFACLLVISMAGVSATPSSAGEPLDTSKLPRVGGAKETFASAPTTILAAPDPVAPTTEATVKALLADGWQSYVAPFTELAKAPNSEFRSFKKGPQALNVSVMLAPAQGNATSIQYIAIPLANDLPFPKDATNIAYAPQRPYMSCLTPATIDATKEFFSTELARQGYAADAAATGNGRFKTDVAANAYYVAAGHPALTLVLARTDDGMTKVVLDGLVASPKLSETTTEKLKAQSDADQKAKGTKEAQSTQKTTASASPQKDSIEQLAADITSRVEKMAADTIAQAQAGNKQAVKVAGADKTPAKSPAETAAKDDAPLAARADNSAPVPLPANAQAVDYKAADGTLAFTAKTSVKAMADFYRVALKPKGWTEKPSVINRPNMVLLEFEDGDKALSLTIMQHGDAVGVSGHGSALEVADAEGSNASAAAPEVEKELEAEEMSHLPIPTAHTFSTGGSGAFRNDVSVNVPAALDTVLAFYRRELSKRGWKEDDGAVIKPEQAVLAFKAPEGPAVLKLDRKNGETVVTLFARHQADAAKSGLLPKSGQVKILLTNLTDTEAVIEINKQKIKIKGGAGTKAPDGPSLELAPGKYKYLSQSAGKTSKSDELQVGADEIWGLAVGPGGGIAMQMY